jgi:hypothetical protein
LVSDGAGAALGSSVGVGSAGAAAEAEAEAEADADAEAAGLAPFFFALGALCASASGATPMTRRATIAKKERRYRVNERDMEDLWSAREREGLSGESTSAGAMLH